LKKVILIAGIIVIVIIGGISGILLFINSNLNSNEDGDLHVYDVEIAFTNLNFYYPVGLYDPNDDTNRLFVVEQAGKIFVFDNEKETATKDLFLDIGTRISTGGERGLLGLAFHPNYKENGYFYVDYTDKNGDTIISRFIVDENNPNLADINSEYIILKVDQPYSNHNGGQIAFGPDGYLYIGLGDGGAGGDPDGNGQNIMTLLGSILRIDVDVGIPYSIPEDSPFKDNNQGYREEIYAYGLRNPWRFSFDFETNTLWTADVGQNSWEEIDIIESGKNYGWNIMEGNHCYSSQNCDQTGLEAPMYEYNHGEGNSITGGFVYRGSKLTALVGKYIYADYGSGKIWSLDYSPGIDVINIELVDTNLQIPSFGIDSDGELYICAFDGKIYRITESNSA
jgi:glucose/arabinose dehydrogenase